MSVFYNFLRGVAFILFLASTSTFAQTFSSEPGASLPDNSCTPNHEFPLEVSLVTSGYLLSEVAVDITHTWDSDLDITLIAPDGTEVELSTDNGSSGDNYTDTHFSDTATTAVTSGSAPFTGVYIPEEPLSAVSAQADGTWILRVCDDAGGDLGTLNWWSLTFSPPPVSAAIGQDCVTAYNGYCPEISVSASQGVPPYTYLWSDGSETATINACPSENTVYSVTVTDASGGISTDEVMVVYVPQDISCGNNKVQICHVDGKGRTKTICVAAPSVAAHLAHGDSLGSCDETYYTCATAPSCVTITSPMDGAVDVSMPVTVEWTAALGLVDGYLVSVGTTPEGTDVVEDAEAGMDLMHTLNDLSFETTYYVSVTAYNSNGMAEGCEGISFTTQMNPCYMAPEIACGETATGSTVDGLVFDVGTCGTNLSTAPGVWYTFTGTGDIVTVDTNGSGYDTKLGVFTGSCDSLVCLDGDDDGGDSVQSLVTFTSEEEVEYLFYVTGYSSNAGDYQLNVTCEAPPSAVMVTCGETINETYCYGNNESADTFIYQSSDGSALTVQFNSGTVENGWDYLIVYDTDGSELYNGTGDISGLSFTSTGDTITFGVDSDGSVSCASGSSCCASGWDFDVSCGESDPEPAEYCESSYSNTSDEWIAGVELNTINNTSGSTNYSDFTAISTDLVAGTSYTVTITPGYGGFAYGESYGVWIDYNQDSVFDGSELVFSTPTTSTTAVSGSFIVPSDASIGATRMRVIQDYSSFDFDPCTTSTYGETEDYTVNILASGAVGKMLNTNNHLSTIDWSMAPNPTRGNVTLDLSNYLLNTVTIDVVDYTGKVISTATVNEVQSAKYTLELRSSLPAGMYFVRVASAAQVSTKKLMIMR